MDINDRQIKKSVFYVYTINGQPPCHVRAVHIKRNLKLVEQFNKISMDYITNTTVKPGPNFTVYHQEFFSK
jgi:hypothetical protein